MHPENNVSCIEKQDWRLRLRNERRRRDRRDGLDLICVVADELARRRRRYRVAELADALKEALALLDDAGERA